MKRYKGLTVIMGMLLMTMLAQAQSPKLPEGVDPSKFMPQLEAYRLYIQEQGLQRGGGRGAPGLPPLDRLNRQIVSIGGAWWTNAALVERLGLADDQKAKIERAFENHRQKLQ